MKKNTKYVLAKNGGTGWWNIHESEAWQEFESHVSKNI